MSIKYIELFAGLGGLGEGFKRAGCECVYANEYNKFSIMTYEANNPEIKVDNRDIRKVLPDEIPDHDILLGGFPCQSFSTIGIAYRMRKDVNKPTGFDDKKYGDLFFEVARIAEAKKPKLIVLENVKNLKFNDDGKTLRTVVTTLRDIGYTIEHRVVNADIWVPQNRERIFIIARLGNEAFWIFPEFEMPLQPTVFRDILHSDDGMEEPEEPYTYIDEFDCLAVKPQFTLTPKTWAYNLRKVEKLGAKNGYVYKITPLDGISRCLTSGYDKESLIEVPGQERPRRLTPRECSRLMGFDSLRGSEFKIPVSTSRAYQQFGNAVCPPVSRVIAEDVLKLLD